jgi:large subunit ribosomal protein L25
MRRRSGESKEAQPLLLSRLCFSIRPGFAPVPTPLEAGRAFDSNKDIIMAAIKQLAAVTRSGTGKGAARSVRREGRVPAVIYGGGLKPEPISVDYKDVNKLIYSGHFLTSIFELEVEGRKERVLPRDYQLDVVTDRPVHVDFLRLAAGSRVRIGVPVHVVNREASPGVKKGGAVNLVLHAVEVMAPADAIPESITIDLTGLDFHDSVHVSAIKLPEGCRPVSSKADQTVVTIVPPTVMVEETTTAPAAAAVAAPGAAPAAPAAGAPAKADAAKGAAAPAKAAAAPAAAKPAAKK